MKDFDDIFSRKAKEAFEKYNADHLADEGWNAYVRKHGRRKSRAIMIPLWARAATIAVLVTTGILFTARFINRKDNGSVNQLARETRSEQTESVINKEDTSSVSLEVVAAKPLRPESKPVAVSKGNTPEVSVSEAGDHLPEGRDEAVSGVDKTYVPVLADAARPDESVSSETVTAAGIPAVVNLATGPAVIRLTDGTEARLRLQPKKSQTDYLVLPRERMTTTLMTGLSGMMASIGNATSSAQGVSIGFYMEQQLTRKISVRPGLAMARHAYSMESASPGRTSLDYAAPELDGLSGTISSYEADIEVVSMEVPVNFVFSLRKRTRTNLFVTTGASTVFYLNQRISGSFNNTYTKTLYDASTGSTSYESMTTTARIDSEREFLNHIDFMGLANFSAGYSFPFSKTSNLLFEPFVQLPLKDLTSLNLRIRYGGISMKLQF